MTQNQPQAAVDANPPSPIRVLTLNTHKGFTSFNRRFVLHELREAIRSVGADIVFLQEVLGSHDEYSRRYANWPQKSHYEFLADSIWPEFAYGRNAVYTKGHHGNAILSKFPIVRYQNHDISITGPEQRGILHSVLRLPGSGIELHALCTHLSLTEAHRNVQLARVCDLIDATVPADAPLVVAGDFNDWRLRAHRVLGRRAKLREAFMEVRGESARTFPARWPLLRLDRIYFRNATVSASARHAHHPWSHLSDHAALSAEITL